MGDQLGPENSGPVRRCGGGGGNEGLLSLPEANLHNVLWVDVTDEPYAPDGSLQYPYNSIDDAVNAAAALLPTASNPVAVIVMPGEYQETVTLDAAADYVYLFGWNRESTILKNGAAGTGTSPLIISSQYTSVQGMTIEAEDTSVRCMRVDWNNNRVGFNEFRECTFLVPSPPNGGDGSVLVQNCTVRFIDCDFIAPGDTVSVYTQGASALYHCVVELISCRFRGVLIFTGFESHYIHGCEIEGRLQGVAGGAAGPQIHDTRIVTTSGQAISAILNGAHIWDCVLTSEAGNYDIGAGTGGTGFLCSNTVMWTLGIHYDNSMSGTRYVGGPGDADYYTTTWHAQRTGGPWLIVLLKDDTITTTLNNAVSAPLTIRGNGHTLTANGCELLTASAGQWIRFEHINLVGRIRVVNGYGTIELLEGTYLTGNIYIDYCGNNNLLIVLDGVEVTGQVIFEDANGYGTVVIKRSRVKPAAGAAIVWADPGSPGPTPSPSLKIKYSTVWNAAGGAADPFSLDPVFAGVSYRSHHSRYNVQPGAVFTNLIAAAMRFDSYDVQTDY